MPFFPFSQVVIFRPSHLHSKLEPNKEVFTGMADPFYIKKFLKASVHGLVGHLTQDNEDQFKKPLCTVYFNVDFERNAKGTVHFNLSKMQPSVLSQLGKVR